MRNLLKNKIVFFALILGICIGLFCAVKGLQNYYFNQNSENSNLVAENTKKIDNRNKTKNNLQKNEAADNSAEKNNSTISQNKSDSSKIDTSINSNTTKNSTATTKSNNNSGGNTSNSTKSINTSGGSSTVLSKINLTIKDEVHGKTLAQAYVDVNGKSVGDVTRAFLDLHHYHYKEKYGGYVAMMFDLYEQKNGPYSGWCFYVNGTKASIGENDFMLKKDDTLVWKYLPDGLSQ